jgi:hypothetical protein
MYPEDGGYQGELVAWDVANARKVWSIKERVFLFIAACWQPGAISSSMGPWMAGSVLPTHARFFKRHE